MGLRSGATAPKRSNLPLFAKVRLPDLLYHVNSGYNICPEYITI